VVNFPDAKFSAALAKYGASNDLELTLAIAKQIYAKLAELKTPFELQELGIGPNLGATLGNVQSPSAVSPSAPPAMPSTMIPGPPEMPPG
jgi:hypothetical protein